jgi:hypothetical protein
MFDNRRAAERRAAEEMHKVNRNLEKTDAKTRDRAQRRLADKLEKRYDDWTRKNVGLD